MYFHLVFWWTCFQPPNKTCLGDCNQDDDGDNAFHIAADAAKFIRECLECILLILKYPGAAIGVRNHRQVL